ncbi:MAG TPA: hypothetical protein VJJ51_14315 [Candidatus Methanoperedens sp.]|nr:hypothetical protein [Candidatus Methanoperedens sp.]
MLGIVESLLGANKIRVRCMDGVVRLARIPGKIKKRIWISGKLARKKRIFKNLNQ